MAGVRKTIFPKAQLWKNDFSLKCSISSSPWCSGSTCWIQVPVQISQFISSNSPQLVQGNESSTKLVFLVKLFLDLAVIEEVQWFKNPIFSIKADQTGLGVMGGGEVFIIIIIRRQDFTRAFYRADVGSLYWDDFYSYFQPSFILSCHLEGLKYFSHWLAFLLCGRIQSLSSSVQMWHKTKW